MTVTDLDSRNGTPQPVVIDRDKILQVLLNFERQGFEATQRGDKAALAGMAIEEFTLIMDGKTYNKEQLLSKVKPRKVLLTLSFERVSLNLEGEIAVLDGIAGLRAQNAPTMGILRQKFTDSLSNVTDDGWRSSHK